MNQEFLEPREWKPIPRKSTINARSKKEKKRLLKPIRKVSIKRQALNLEYKELRIDFLREHPYCQWFMQEHGIDEEVAKNNLGIVLCKIDGEFRYIHVPRSEQVHHRRGRAGNLLIDIRFFLAVSEQAHRFIHDNPKISYEKGYMLPR